jgi:copper chaperone CopZ
MNELKLYVSGMSCDGCVNSVRTILSNGLGIPKDNVDVSLDNGTAVIKPGDTSETSSDQLDATLYELKKQGFPAQRLD